MRRKSTLLLLLFAGCGPVATFDDAGAPDGGMDAATQDAGPPDAGHDAGPPDSGTDAGTDAGPTCPDGTTPGTANGMFVCWTANGIPRFTNVFVIVMENTSLSTLTGATNTPYVTSLFSTWATASDYHGVAHPSLPNYIAMTSGIDVSGIECDCDPIGSSCTSLNCNSLLHSCGCPQSTTHLGDQLETAGLDWRAYGEGMGSPCNASAAGDYVPRHVPFVYYQNIQMSAPRCVDHVVPYSQFATDLGSGPRALSFIAPSLVHDMHDPVLSHSTAIGNGDSWLSDNVPAILASSAFTDGGVLFIVWDEDDLSGTLAADNPIPLIVLSPYAKQGGFVSSVHADHSSLLATIEDGLGLARLGSAAGATPLSDFFPSE